MTDLLKVLDMDADNQFWAIQKYLSKDLAELYDTQEISLADLAFRLRDEIVEQNFTLWQQTMDIVFLKTNEEYWKEEHPFTRWTAVTFWFNHTAKPIHWIIAALIAKDKK